MVYFSTRRWYTFQLIYTQEYTSLDKGTIRRHFTYGEGPEVRPNLNNNLGWWGKANQDFSLSINESMVKSMEEHLKNGNTLEAEARILLTIITILHEYIHLGDKLSHIFFTNGNEDRGDEFEKDFFGVLMDDYPIVKEMFLNRTEYVTRNSPSYNELYRGSNYFMNLLSTLGSGTYIIVNNQPVRIK